MNCTQVQEYDKTVTAKDNKIKELQSQLSDSSGSSFPEVQDVLITLEETKSIGKVTREPRREQAPQLTLSPKKTQKSNLMTYFQP